MLYFEHKGWYRAGNLWKDIFLVVPSPDDNKNLAGLASFDFRILWRHVRIRNDEILRALLILLLGNFLNVNNDFKTNRPIEFCPGNVVISKKRKPK